MNNYYVYSLNDNDLSIQQQQKRYSNLQTIELKNQVILTHETYLQLDDNDQRDEYRKKLHKTVVNYLLKIPHQNKFLLPELNFIFENCVENNSLFEPLKAAESFDVLFKITNNLILKPWRKEFYQICIYNGYFKHLVSQQIPHYEHLLKLMGYELKSKNGILNYYLTQRVSNEVLKLISFDCYVAYVEFRYIHQFAEILRNKNIRPNWSNIYNLRRKFTGDFESTLDSYLMIYNDQISEQQINRKYKHLSNLISQYEQHQQADSIEKQTKVNNNNLIDLDSLPPVANKYDSLEQLLLNSSSPDHYRSTNNNSYNNHHQATNNHQFSNHQLNNQFDNQINHHQTNGGQMNYLTQNQLNNDYYLIKHNLTNQMTNHHQAPKETNLDQVDFIDDCDEEDTMVNLMKDELNSKIKCLDSNAQKLELAMKSQHNDQLNGKIKSNSLEKRSSSKGRTTNEKKYSTLDYIKQDKKSTKSRFACKHCTYLNESKDGICKMCSKSMKGPIDPNNELTILGRECNLCTLINKKNGSNCKACGNSLTKDSPTYI